MATEEPTIFGIKSHLPKSFSVYRRGSAVAENADSLAELQGRAISNRFDGANDDETLAAPSTNDSTGRNNASIFDPVLLLLCQLFLSLFSITRPFFGFLVAGMFMYTFQLANNVTNEISTYHDAPAPINATKGTRFHRRGDDDNYKMTPWLVQDRYYSQSGQDDVEIIRKANQVISLPDEKDWLVSEPSYDREAYFQQYQQIIPKLLHKMILTATGGFPEPFLEILNTSRINHTDLPLNHKSLADAHLSWNEMNPEYEIRYYNLHLCRSYLQQFYHPIFLRAFDCIEALSAKADFFRTLVVYRDGGFYSDWEQVCMVDGLLKWLSSENATWFATFDHPGESNRLQCAFFGAPPRSPILAEAVRMSLHNLQSRADLMKYNTTDAVFHISGSGVFGDAFWRVGTRLGWNLPRQIEQHQNWNRIPGVRLGVSRFLQGRVQWLDYGNQHIILHKCRHCGFGQSWKMGNEYLIKFARGEYFCPDAPSLFLPKERIGNISVSV